MVFDVELLDVKVDKTSMTPADAIKDTTNLPGDSVGDATAQQSDSGLMWFDMEEGSGAAPADSTTTVRVHYTGWLYDPAADNLRGTKFDSSVDRGAHFRFTLGEGRVIRGWDQGVPGMRIGEVRELTIAPEMGYGERGAGALIPPNSTLVCVVELAGLEGLEAAN